MVIGSVTMVKNHTGSNRLESYNSYQNSHEIDQMTTMTKKRKSPPMDQAHAIRNCWGNL